MRENRKPDERVISVRLLPEEAEILQAKAEEAQMSKSRFLKNVIVYGGAYKKTSFKIADSQKLGYEIDRIGNNLNQISVRAYCSQNIDKIEFLKLRDNYLELLSAYYDFIQGRENKNDRK